MQRSEYIAPAIDVSEFGCTSLICTSNYGNTQDYSPGNWYWTD